MATSLAFQITSEDVENVLGQNTLVSALPDGGSLESLAEKLFDELNFFEIEKAVLYGDELEQQTTYAYEEIARQLRERGVLESVAPSSVQTPRN